MWNGSQAGIRARGNKRIPACDRSVFGIAYGFWFAKMQESFCSFGAEQNQTKPENLLWQNGKFQEV